MTSTASEFDTKFKELLSDDCYKDYELQLDKLAQKLELSIFAAKFTNPKISGAIYRDSQTNKFNICVNERYSIVRQRFIAAYEIAHYFYATYWDSDFKKILINEGIEDHVVMDMKKVGVVERARRERAKNLATEMLMPKEKVMQFIKDGISIEKIAELFFVSQQAVAIRINNLGIDILV